MLVCISVYSDDAWTITCSHIINIRIITSCFTCTCQLALRSWYSNVMPTKRMSFSKLTMWRRDCQERRLLSSIQPNNLQPLIMTLDSMHSFSLLGGGFEC